MQQTKKYRLNKIDIDDTFSPDPLNENMDKVEAKFAALDGTDEALLSRVTALEGHKIAVGNYVGNNSSQTITLGFKPQVVYVFCTRLGHAMAIQGYPYLSDAIAITENGFSVSCNTVVTMNCQGDRYIYFAIK